MTQKSDTPKKPGPVFLVHLLLIPHRDRDRVHLVQVEVIVLVPLWVKGVFGSVCAMGLPRTIHGHSHKRVGQPEKVPLSEVPSAQHSHPDLHSSVPVIHFRDIAAFKPIHRSLRPITVYAATAVPPNPKH